MGGSEETTSNTTTVTDATSTSGPCPPGTPCPPPNVTVVNSTVLETAPQIELPSVFNSPFRIPCFKSSLLAGSAAGGIMTATLLILKKPFFFSSNMGMATFVSVSIGKWFHCRSQFEEKRDIVKKVMLAQSSSSKQPIWVRITPETEKENVQITPAPAPPESVVASSSSQPSPSSPSSSSSS